MDCEITPSPNLDCGEHDRFIIKLTAEEPALLVVRAHPPVVNRHPLFLLIRVDFHFGVAILQ